jgi:hypothetical protein
MGEGRARRPAVPTADRRPLASLIHQPGAWSGNVIAAITIGSPRGGSATGVTAATAYAAGCTGR